MNTAEAIITYIENDSEIAIPIEMFFNKDGSPITKKEYGKILLKVLCEELREKFASQLQPTPTEIIDGKYISYNGERFVRESYVLEQFVPKYLLMLLESGRIKIPFGNQEYFSKFEGKPIDIFNSFIPELASTPTEDIEKLAEKAIPDHPYPDMSYPATAVTQIQRKTWASGYKAALSKENDLVEREDNLEASQIHPQPSASVVSLPASSGNSIQQIKTLLTDIVNQGVDVYDNALHLTMFNWVEKINKCLQFLNNVPKAQVSDTTGDETKV